jgi:NADH-quinone oxidoreductase subunit B
MGEVKEKKTNKNNEKSEEIPGVITTTTSAIHNLLKKSKVQDIINWGRKKLALVYDSTYGLLRC